MLKAEITEPTATTRTGNSNGRDWKIRSQNILIELNGEKRRIAMNLEDDQAPFPIGHYMIDPEKNLYFDRMGNLAVSRRFDLIPYSNAESSTATVEPKEPKPLFGKTS